MNTNVLKRFVIYMAILTFVMFTVWAFVRSFMDRPPGDYETEVCDIRLKDKEYERALEACKSSFKQDSQSPWSHDVQSAGIYFWKKNYVEADNILSNLIIFLENNLEDDDKTGIGTLAAAYANRVII